MRGLTLNSGNPYGLGLIHDISARNRRLVSAYIQSNTGAGSLGFLQCHLGLKKKTSCTSGPQATAPGALLRYHKQPH